MPIDTAGHRAGPGDFFLPRTERYEIRDRLGIGSLGAVFRALDRETELIHGFGMDREDAAEPSRDAER